MGWFFPCLDGFFIAAQGVLHTAFLCRLAGRRPRKRYFAGYLALLFGIQGASVAFGWGLFPAAAMELAALYGMGRLVLKRKPASACAAALLAVYVCQLATGAVNSLESALISRVAAGYVPYALLVLGTLATPALCALCYGLALRLLPPEEGGLSLLPLPSLFFFAAEVYILETAYSSSSYQEAAGKHLALLLLQILGLAALLCTLYVCRRAGREFRVRAELDSLAQSVQAQRIYVAEAQARYEKTRSFRHDLQNHLSVLDGLLRAGRAEEARDYLRKLEAASAELSPLCRTGKAEVDVLLGEKLTLARDRGIDAEAVLRLPEGVDGFDLCVIFANALDNALAACGAAGEGAFLRVRDQRQGDLYCLSFENSCVPGPLPKPGTGLGNIKAAAEKYRGAVEFQRTGGRFRLDVLLNISEQKGGSSGQKP